MKKHQLLILFIVIVFSSCSSNKEECFKEASQDYIVGIGGIAHYYTEAVTIKCDEDISNNRPIDGVLPLLNNFDYTVLKFEHNPKTTNNTSRLYFEVELKNLNDFEVKGVPVFKMKTNIEFDTTYNPYIKMPCEVLKSNSSCVVVVEIEEANNGNTAGSVELIDVTYALVRKTR